MRRLASTVTTRASTMTTRPSTMSARASTMTTRASTMTARATAMTACATAMTACVATVSVCLALLCGAPAASATPADDAATHAYIVANYALARASEGLARTGQRNFEGLKRRLTHECDGVGAGSPENEAAEPFSYEVTGAIWSVSYGTAAKPIATFVHAVSHLHWSNPRLTQIAKTYASTLHKLATLPLPPLCSDVQAWHANNFGTIPASVTSFDKYVESLEVKPISPKLLTPYEQPGDAGLVQGTARLEGELLDLETSQGYSDLETLLDTLGLHL
jgi:hypothetical protein